MDWALTLIMFREMRSYENQHKWLTQLQPANTIYTEDAKVLGIDGASKLDDVR